MNKGNRYSIMYTTAWPSESVILSLFCNFKKFKMNSFYGYKKKKMK